jgi:hypothetical protein
VLAGCGRLARSGWAKLGRNAEREERVYWTLNGARHSPVKKNHTAEEMANGKVGSLNQ